MQSVRRVAIGFVVVWMAVVPGMARAAGTPTPAPTPTAAVKATATPTSAPAAPTAQPMVPVAPAATSSAGVGSQPAGAGSDQASPAAEATAEPTAAPSPTPQELAPDTFTVWHGVVRKGGAYRRSAPSAGAEIEEELDPGTPIRIDRWLAGSMMYPDVITWGEVDPDDGGGYIFGGSLKGVLPPAAPPPPEAMQDAQGTWIDVNLTLEVVTAYQDGQPVESMLASPGRPGYETDTGLFSVRTKLVRQNMSGPGYFVPNVPTVQYFYGGEALHGRYWTLPAELGPTSAGVDDDGSIQSVDDPSLADGGSNVGVAFGVPSSHGCVGLQVDDAAWLYSITGVGTPVDVHY
jgi:hypothetical protein